MDNRARTPLRAFTLIELLIVVAIIAILAAIAVPNFIEAQTRSKVSRARADMRSVGTAVESYRVDTGKYPWHIIQNGVLHWYVMGYEITTPIAYLTSRGALGDPFLVGYDGNTSSNANFPSRAFDIEYKWVNWETRDDIQSRNGFAAAGGNPFARPQWYGVNRQPKVPEHGPWELASVGPSQQWLTVVQPNVTFGHYFIPYDPSNGSISAGAIIRNGRSGEGTTATGYVGGNPVFPTPSF